MSERWSRLSNYKELKVWRKAHAMTLDIYRVTAGFPREEICGLTQSNAAGVGVGGSNYCRGLRETTDGERGRISRALGIGSPLFEEGRFRSLTNQADEVQRMLTGLMQSVRTAKTA